MLRRLVLIVICSLIIGVPKASADTITFETLPDANFFSSGGQNIGSFYSGVTFGADVTGLSVTRFGGYGDAGFPPHSGDVVIWSAFDPDVTISFATNQDSVGIWYSSYDFLTLSAFDSLGGLLGSVTGNPNTDGFTGISSFLSFDSSGISSVTLTGSSSLFVLDDLTFTPGATPVPEPATIYLLASGLVLILARRARASGLTKNAPVVLR